MTQIVAQTTPQLKQLQALAFDAGDCDQSIAASVKVLGQVLTDYHIIHTYEEYEGNHINRIGERTEQKMLPFFAKYLSK